MNAKTSDQPRTWIILLGTGTPNADPDRSGPSVAVVVDGTPYIVDCGPGVVRRAAAAGLDVRELKLVFITHLHSDHTVGYPDLIFTPWVLGRDEPLEVFGPAGIKAMTDHIIAAYEKDIHERLYGLEHADREGWKVNAHEIDTTSGTGSTLDMKPNMEKGRMTGAMIYRDAGVRVEAFPVSHGSFRAYGYKFVTPDRTIVVSGDTAPVEIMVEQSRGCDVLIHEVYSVSGFDARSPAWQKYHSSVHTSSRELAEIASRAKPGLLVLYHQLFWGAAEDELLEEVGEVYPGRVVSGKDLDVF